MALRKGTIIQNEFDLSVVNAQELMSLDTFNLVSVDPGVTTGLAVWKVTPKLQQYQLLECIEVKWESRLPVITEILQMYIPQIVVVETYRLFAEQAAVQIGSNIAAVEVKGIVLGIHYLVGVKELGSQPLLVLQNPGQQHSTKVRTIDLTAVRGSEHKEDAYRHGRFAILRLFSLADKQAKD